MKAEYTHNQDLQGFKIFIFLISFLRKLPKDVSWKDEGINQGEGRCQSQCTTEELIQSRGK